MGKYIPVEPEKWAEMVKAMAEVTRLKADVARMTKELADEKSAHSNVENRQQNQLRVLSMENFNLKAEVVHDLNQIGGLQEENARLKAEVERLTNCKSEADRLKAEVERSTAWGRGLESDLSHARVEISFLKAEAEKSKRINTELLVLSNRQASDIRRLHKAGDAMQKRLYVLENPTHPEVYLKLLSAWLAAKEGKPSV
jgi:uncharacterized small protein (DUF1192 family)